MSMVAGIKGGVGVGQWVMERTETIRKYKNKKGFIYPCNRPWRLIGL
jgi:hypothetical protein